MEPAAGDERWPCRYNVVEWTEGYYVLLRLHESGWRWNERTAIEGDDEERQKPMRKRKEEDDEMEKKKRKEEKRRGREEKRKRRRAAGLKVEAESPRMPGFT